MDIVHKVLTDCLILYTENIVHEAKCKKQKAVIDSTRTITAKFMNIDLEVRPTYQSDILRITARFHDSTSDAYIAKQLADCLSIMTGVLDSPSLYMHNNFPNRIEYMIRVDSSYTFAVIVNILSNFPRNMSNDLL